MAEPWRETMVEEARKYSQICDKMSIDHSKMVQKAARFRTHPEPSLAVLGLDLVTVAQPVAVPAPESSRVVDTNGVDTLDLKSRTLKAVDNKSKRSTSVGTGKDVLVHEQTPDQILILPRLTQTSDLEEENTIIVKHLIDLGQERAKVTDTDVLGHLETGDLLVATGDVGSVTVVHAENPTLRLVNASLAQSVVTPRSLVAAQGDTSDVSTIVDGSILGQSTPATAKIKDGVSGLESNLLTNDSQLVILQLLESLFLVDVTDNARSIDHARSQEPSVEVITTVIVVTDLLLI